MKKLLSLILVLALAMSFVACSAPAASSEAEAPASSEAEAPAVEEADSYEIAMITDLGEIDDKSFNQGTWEGIVAYADANNKTCQYYKPSEQSNDAYLSAIELAVKGGAKVVVTPGFLFEQPIYIAQDQYPDVHFILVDGNPNNVTYNEDGTTEGEYRTADNAVGITFAEEQAGYLAGYSIVKEGYTKLGFMGGLAVPAVIRYGYGFVDGANAAGEELGVDVEVKYNYTGSFVATPEIQTMATGWYNAGTEVIFACGGKICNSAFAAAEATGTKTIGVDIDQAADSETVVTSSMKGLAEAVSQTLDKFYADEFPGGESLKLGAANNAVKLPMDTSRFENFTAEEYETLFAALADDSIVPANDSTVAGPAELSTETTTVIVVE